MKLVLASSSPRRAEVLADAGFAFEVCAADVNESQLPGELPESCVRRLAEAKARVVAARVRPPAFVVAADTVVVLEGGMLGKPASSEDAAQMLRHLAGRTHQVLTGLAVLKLPEGAARIEIEATQVTIAALRDAEIEAYVATGEPRDKAGAYAIQGRGGRFVSRVEGCYFNVVGLPLARLHRILNELGWKET